MTSYAPIVTIAGRAADMASRLTGGAPVDLAGSTVIFGDGGGASVAFTDATTSLVNQIASMPVSSAYADASDPTKIWVECTYGDPPGGVAPRGYTIRECAIRLPTGALYAVAAFPERFLPMPTSGAAVTFTLRIPLVETLSGVNLALAQNESVYATETWVDEHWAGDIARLLESLARTDADVSALRTANEAQQRQIDMLTRAVGRLTGGDF